MHKYEEITTEELERKAFFRASSKENVHSGISLLMRCLLEGPIMFLLAMASSTATGKTLNPTWAMCAILSLCASEFCSIAALWMGITASRMALSINSTTSLDPAYAHASGKNFEIEMNRLHAWIAKLKKWHYIVLVSATVLVCLGFTAAAVSFLV